MSIAKLWPWMRGILSAGGVELCGVWSMKRARCVAYVSALVFASFGLFFCLGSGSASAQTYYQPEGIYGQRREVVQPRRYQHGEPRFYLPFLKPSQVYEEPAPGYRGAYTTTPQGRRAFYVPAPRQVEDDDEQDDVIEVVPRQPSPQSTENGKSVVEPKFRKQTVPYSGPHKPGTVVINSSERHLYLVQDDGTALRYGIGVGREGFGWKGDTAVSRKAEWPDWRPPAEMIARRPDLPRFMPGGPSNPLGARALYLGNSLYRIHGTNEPHTIGKAVSSGCFRMVNDDVVDLFSRVKVGARVVVN